MEQKVATVALAPDRQRSGLVRSFGVFGAFLFGVHCISLSSSGFIPFSWVASVWPGASIAGVLLIAAIFCLVHGASYAAIGSTVPLAGADYVFASRTAPPALAFAASWTLVLFSGFVAGGLAAWIPKGALPALFRPMAILFQDSRFEGIADFSSTATGSFMIGGAVILIAALTVTTANLNIQRILAVGFALGIAAWLVIYFSLSSASSPSDFQAAWDSFMGPTGRFGAFSERVPLAEAAGMNLNSSLGQTYLAGLIMGFWIFYGYYIPTFFSEEVRRPAKTLLIASASSIIVALAIFIGGTLLLQRLVPLEWIAAEGYLFNNPDAVAKAAGGEPVTAMPWITFYAAILQPKPWLLFIVAFGWIFTLINLVQTYFYYSSRIVLSWALDRVVPSWITALGSRSGSPVRAIWISAALALVGLYDASTGGPLGTQLTFVFFAVSTQLVAVTCLVFLPKWNPALYRAMPAAFRRRILGAPIIVVVSTVSLLYLLWMIVASFVYPAVGVARPQSTLLLLLAMLGSGIVWFYAIRFYRLRKEGIDILATYRLPVTTAEGPDFE